MVAIDDAHRQESPGDGDEVERFQFYFRQHWIRIFPSFMRMFLGVCFLLGFGYLLFVRLDVEESFIRRIILLLLLSAFLITQCEFLTRLYRYFLYIVIVTDKRIHRIKKTLITTDEHESVDLWVLQDINKSQRGIIQNLLRFGSLILEAQNTQLRIHFTPRIDEKYRAIMRLHEMARRKLPEGETQTQEA